MATNSSFKMMRRKKEEEQQKGETNWFWVNYSFRGFLNIVAIRKTGWILTGLQSKQGNDVQLETSGRKLSCEIR